MEPLRKYIAEEPWEVVTYIHCLMVTLGSSYFGLIVANEYQHLPMYTSRASGRPVKCKAIVQDKRVATWEKMDGEIPKPMDVAVFLSPCPVP